MPRERYVPRTCPLCLQLLESYLILHEFTVVRSGKTMTTLGLKCKEEGHDYYLKVANDCVGE
jgi:hypothetical protein